MPRAVKVYQEGGYYIGLYGSIYEAVKALENDPAEFHLFDEGTDEPIGVIHYDGSSS